MSQSISLSFKHSTCPSILQLTVSLLINQSINQSTNVTINPSSSMALTGTSSIPSIFSIHTRASCSRFTSYFSCIWKTKENVLRLQCSKVLTFKTCKMRIKTTIISCAIKVLHFPPMQRTLERNGRLNCVVPMGFIPHGNFGLLSPGKASCDRVAQPDLRCMLGVLVFP